MAAWGLLLPRSENTYAETNYTNPHAPSTFFSNGATTTFTYDNNGNTASTTGAATSILWDYKNRMISAWVSGATSTYADDHTVQRVRQTSTTTTT